MSGQLKRACDLCNIRKVKCDRGNPCTRCVGAGYDCTALRQHRKSGPRSLRQSKVKILKQQQQQHSLEQSPQEQCQHEQHEHGHQQSSPVDSSDGCIWPAETQSSHYTSQPSSPALSITPSTSLNLFLSDQACFSNFILPVPPWDLSRIPLPQLRAVLLLYHEKLYGIWPLLRVDDLLFRLETEINDPQPYALATAVCGATLSYLEGDCSIYQISEEPLLAETFVAESRRVRASFDYMDPVGLDTILTSYFIHMHYGRQPSRTTMAAFYIREAITFAHLLGLHNESTYTCPPWKPREQAIMRRLYFLLFMTERYLCIQQGLPTVLDSIDLPSVLETDPDEQYPELIKGFLNLVTLFSTPGKSFFGMWTTNSRSRHISKDQLLLIQRAIQASLPFPDMDTLGRHNSSVETSLPNPVLGSHIQLVDIVVSQHWLRSLTWKLSVLSGYVSPISGSTGTLSVTYPLEIAVDTLRGIQRFPKQAFEAHGPGMEAKMCEIAAALADSINCSPAGDNSADRYCKDIGAKTVLKALTDRIFETQTMSSYLRDSLTRKVAGLLDHSSISPNISIHQDLPNEQQYDFNDSQQSTI